LKKEGLAVLSGILLFLSFPKFGHGILAWIALAPLLIALHGAGGRSGLRLGYLTGAVSALGVLYWTALVVIQYGGLSLPVGIAVMTLLCLAFALFPALFGWVVARWSTALGAPGLLLAPVAWVGTEILRAHTFFEFPWCLLGYSQHANLPFIQIASVTAVYGVSFLVATTSALLAYAGVERRRRERRLALVALPMLVIGAWAWGRSVMGRPLAESGRITVGLVQGGIAQEDKWVPENATANVERHLELTERAAAAGAKLVVWPESAVPFLFDETPEMASALEGVVERHGMFLYFGNDDRDPEHVYVGAKMLAPNGDLVYRYHKIHLVPFGEYVPMQRLLTLGGRVTAKLVQQVSDFTPGSEATVARADGHALGGFICYEAIFPALVRRFPAQGAELLVNITNDAWYGRTSAPYQHLSMAVFRAVENGRYLVRAANTGITAVVDPRGRVLEETPLFVPTVLVREVPFLTGQTFYSRYGDVFAGSCLLASVGLTILALRMRTEA
jgi:apolipoprotein N-acyltransferase